MSKLKTYEYTAKFEHGEASGSVQATSQKKAKEQIRALYETGSTKKGAANQVNPVKSLTLEEVA